MLLNAILKASQSGKEEVLHSFLYSSKQDNNSVKGKADTFIDHCTENGQVQALYFNSQLVQTCLLTCEQEKAPRGSCFLTFTVMNGAVDLLLQVQSHSV